MKTTRFSFVFGECCFDYRQKIVKLKQSGRTQVLEEARTMDYVTNHNMITMAMSIFKTLNMAAERRGM